MQKEEKEGGERKETERNVRGVLYLYFCISTMGLDRVLADKQRTLIYSTTCSSGHLLQV